MITVLILKDSFRSSQSYLESADHSQTCKKQFTFIECIPNLNFYHFLDFMSKLNTFCLRGTTTSAIGFLEFLVGVIRRDVRFSSDTVRLLHLPRVLMT